MSLTQISIDNERLARLDALAAQESTSREALVNQAIDDLLTKADTDAAYEAWFRRKVEAGLRDVREGRVVSHEQIEADAKARREKLLAVSQVS